MESDTMAQEQVSENSFPIVRMRKEGKLRLMKRPASDPGLGGNTINEAEVGLAIEVPKILIDKGTNTAETVNISEKTTTADIPVYQTFIESLQKRFVPHRRLKEDLQETEWVCVQANVCSFSGEGYLGITVHWINPVQGKKWVRGLSFQRIKDTQHSSVEIAIEEVVREFGLDFKKIVSFVICKGSNFLRGFERHVKGILADYEHKEKVEAETLSDLPHFKFNAGYELNLLATTVLNTFLQDNEDIGRIYRSAMGKIGCLWAADSSKEKSQTIREIFGKKLAQPVKRDWRSQHKALTEMLSEEKKANMALESLGLSKLSITELTVLEEIIEIYKPIARITAVLETAKLGKMLPKLLFLKMNLKAFLTTQWRYASSLVVFLLNKLEERFASTLKWISPAVIATVSIPSCKLKWVEEYEAAWSRTEVVQSFYRAVRVLIQKYPTTKESKGDMDESAKKEIDKEVRAYLQDPDESFQVFNKYPNVKRVYLHYNTTLACTPRTKKLV